jgi:hypothetical protein
LPGYGLERVRRLAGEHTGSANRSTIFMHPPPPGHAARAVSHPPSASVGARLPSLRAAPVGSRQSGGGTTTTGLIGQGVADASENESGEASSPPASRPRSRRHIPDGCCGVVETPGEEEWTGRGVHDDHLCVQVPGQLGGLCEGVRRDIRPVHTDEHVPFAHVWLTLPGMHCGEHLLTRIACSRRGFDWSAVALPSYGRSGA